MLLTDLILGTWYLRTLPNGDSALLATLQTLPYYLLMLHSWFYAVAGTTSLTYQIGINAPLTWSISTECFFYLAYPIVCVLLIKIKRLRDVVLGCVAISIFWILLNILIGNHKDAINWWAVDRFGPTADMNIAYQDSFYRWLVTLSPYARIGEFLLGCLVAKAYTLTKELAIRSIEKVIGYGLLLVSISSIFLLLDPMYSPTGENGLIRITNSNLGFAPSVALLIFCCARYPTFVSRWLGARFMVLAGEASYSIYLLHFLVFWMIATPPHPALAQYDALLFMAIKFVYALLLIILISIGLYTVYELPVRKWLKGIDTPALSRLRVIIIRGCILIAPITLALGAFAAYATLSGEYANDNPQKGVRVLSATYGGNCGAAAGNASAGIRRECNGKSSCSYRVNVMIIGEPAAGCSKDFTVKYECVSTQNILETKVPAEAGLGGVATLSCGQ